MDLLSISLSTEEVLPSVGNVCDIRYHMASDTRTSWPIADEFACSPAPMGISAEQ